MRRVSRSRFPRVLAAAVAMLAAAGICRFALGQQHAIINNGQSPHSRLRSVDLSDVRWTDGFWKQKFDLVKDVTIPKMWEYFNTDYDAEGGHHWIDFRIGAGLQEGPWKGRSWHDGDFYKWLEAVAHVYMVTKDPRLDQQMDDVIEIIGKAQQPDGYLSTQIILQKWPRFQNIHHHELYNMGHLMTAACIHHRATGKDSFLKTARNVGDYLYETFKDRKPELAHFGFNPSNIMGAVELYRTTGDRRYLDLANTFIDMRGSQPAGSRHTGLGGTDQTQDRVPLRNETEAVGHAVTATYLYCGAADAYMETGDETLLAALNRIWSDVVRRKLYIHGGVGPLTRGMSSRYDDVHEAFADPYFLPNRQCYCETCANIGNAMWNWRMLNITGDAKYADVMERVWYNGGISGLGLDGDSFLYTNVLRRFGRDVPLLRSDRPDRWKHRVGYCCPPQLARTVAQMHGYVYSTSEDALWVHLYGGNALDTQLADGRKLKLTQKTNYPWDGKVRLQIEDVAAGKPFAIMLRIPEWAIGATVRVNGQPAGVEVVAGRYTTLRRAWSGGDVVELSLPMQVRLVRANPLAEELRGQVAVMRGPVLYCLESVDLPDGTDVMEVALPADADLTPRFDADFLGGVVVLEGTAIHWENTGWREAAWDAERLYEDASRPRLRPVSVRLIPYHAWLNRGPSQMTVWMPFALRDPSSSDTANSRTAGKLAEDSE